jgi:hypothetical protein
MTPRFDLGQILCTPGYEALQPTWQDTITLLRKHVTLDPDGSLLDAEDQQLNDHDARQGGRILSAYALRGTKVWIITEADRSVTTFLLPEEY